MQLVPGAEEPEEVRWEGYSLVACPKEKQPVLRYLVLSRHLLYVYESKEAYYGHGVCTPPPPQGCIRREGTSEAAQEAARQAVERGCQSGWGRLL